MIEDPNLAKLSMFRVFLQEDGINPSNDYNYHGDLTLGGLNEPQGDLTPIYLPSPDQRGEWIIVGFTRSVPGLVTTDFTSRMQRTLRSVWWQLRKTRCPFNAQVLVGDCQQPDDLNDWLAKMLLNRTVITDLTGPVINPLTGEEEDVANLTGSLTMLSMEVIYPLLFQEYADTEILSDAVDGFYNSLITCGDCGDADKGCDDLFVLTIADAGSPGLSSQIVYTRDDKSTFVVRDINTLGGASASRMIPMGKFLVVISEDDGAHHVISFKNLYANSPTGWSRVTGYASGGSPRAIHRLSATRAIVAGAGGHIYRLTNATAAPTILSDGSITTQNFNDVGGNGNVIVVVGNSNAVVVSVNKGDSFTLKAAIDQDGILLGGNITAVSVISNNQWFIGVNGELWYTLDQGDSYIQQSDWPADINVINDIKFVDEQVGYIAAEAGGVGRVYRTDTVGNVWDNDAPAIDGLPTAVRYNFVAPCQFNEVAAGGRITAGGDGVLAVAQ